MPSHVVPVFLGNFFGSKLGPSGPARGEMLGAGLLGRHGVDRALQSSDVDLDDRACSLRGAEDALNIGLTERDSGHLFPRRFWRSMAFASVRNLNISWISG